VLLLPLSIVRKRKIKTVFKNFRFLGKELGVLWASRKGVWKVRFVPWKIL